MALPSKIRKSVNQQATNVLRTGSRFDRFDQIRQRHFWSSWLIAADANGYAQARQYPFFTAPQGQAAQGYAGATSLRETNWVGSNRVPDNQNFEVTEIGISVYFNQAVRPAYRAALLSHFVVGIQYLTNNVPLGVALDYSQASGPTMGQYSPRDFAPAPDPQLPRPYATNGFPSPALRRRFKIPIMLGHGETFSFTLTLTRPVWLGSLQSGLQFETRFEFFATESFVEKS